MFWDPQTFIFLQETSFEQCQFQIIISKNLILCRKQEFVHHFEVCIDQIFEVCATQNVGQIFDQLVHPNVLDLSLCFVSAKM